VLGIVTSLSFLSVELENGEDIGLIDEDVSKLITDEKQDSGDVSEHRCNAVSLFFILYLICKNLGKN